MNHTGKKIAALFLIAAAMLLFVDAVLEISGVSFGAEVLPDAKAGGKECIEPDGCPELPFCCPPIKP